MKKQLFLYSFICLVTGLIFFSDPYLVFTIGLSFLLSETLLNFYFTLKGDKIEPRISGIILCSLLLAYSMRILLNKSGYFFITGESASFVEFSKLGFNISLFAQGILKLFNGFFPGERILSFPAVLHFANLGILLAGSYGMYLLFRKKFMQRDSIGVFIPVCFLVTILAYVLSNRAIDIQCTRYLVLVPFLFAFGLYFLIDERVAGKTATVVFSLVLALAVAANFIHISANYHIKPLRTQGGDPKIPQILLNEGLTYGYSDFWHAAINTFTSKETVRIRQIACMDGRIGPLHWISSEQWYRPDAFVGKTFLLVDYHGAGKPFFEKCSTDMIINQFGMPEKQLQFDVDGSSLLLMIFNYNISQHF